MCRSRQKLSNAYLLAKFGFDTAENEPCKVCPTPRGAAGPLCDGQSKRSPPGADLLGEEVVLGLEIAMGVLQVVHVVQPREHLE